MLNEKKEEMKQVITEAQLNEIKNLVRSDEIFMNEPMKKHTTMRIGGPAEVFLKPRAVEIEKLLDYLAKEEIKTFILGNGSDLLVTDEGLSGVVVSTRSMNSINVNEGTGVVTADAGVSLGKIANAAKNASLAGFEFAAGIPGSLGGGVFMNAGAYGGEMKHVVKSVKYFDPENGVQTVSGDEADFGYRHSIFSENPSFVILSAEIQLERGNFEEIDALQKDLMNRRIEKQPLEYASAGSTFKRPEGYFAGKLIQDAGLMGYHVGDAEVSTKHAGFVVNTGNATSNSLIYLKILSIFSAPSSQLSLV
jgi:UDP-N-acetylmuramate dehydrogenase